MYFSRIELANWKNFSKFKVDLSRRVFIIGPNASGKSNLLDAIRFLRDIARVGGGLRTAINDRGGVSKIRSLAARRYPDIVFDIEISSDLRDASRQKWRYRLAIAQDNQRLPVIKEETVWKNGRIVLSRPDETDKKDKERLRETYLEQVTANRDFRDLTNFFSSINYYHIVPQLIRDPDRSVGLKNDPFGGDFLEQIDKYPQKTRASRLRKILEALEVAVPQLSELNWERDAKGKPHLKGKYNHWRGEGAWQNEEQFSDGTLRLIGLLWSLLDGSGPLLLEEPELSLHTEVVRHIPQMISRLQRKNQRQVFISTHSEDLLRDKGIGPEEVLILKPTKDGTTLELASKNKQIVTLTKGGLSMSEAAIPFTRPPRAMQLSLFDY